jgi:hypothetical protein
VKQFFVVLLVIIVFLVVCVPQPIDLDNYPVQRDYGTLSPEEQKLFDEIMAASEVELCTILCDEETDRNKLLIHFGMYYGTMEGVSNLFSPTDYGVFLHPEVFREFEKNRIIVEARVDEALMNLKEGSDRFKLWQIAKYLADRITYTDGTWDAISGLNGEGVCATYAMLFYKMASRLGIECYYCVGYAGGSLHAWNMVVLDGEEYFYDVTWFDDVVYDYRYLHSPTAWGREYTLNGV